MLYKDYLTQTNLQSERLTLIKRTPQRSNNGKRLYLFQCTCGNQILASLDHVGKGKTESCGCLHRERIVKHGGYKFPEYAIWQAMKSRCTNRKNKSYMNYGGRGITFEPNWSDFSHFIKDMGRRPHIGLTLERKDNNLGYTKDNCVWANRTAQILNRRGMVLIEHNGESLCCSHWATKLDIPIATLYRWVRSGLTIAEAITRKANSHPIQV